MSFREKDYEAFLDKRGIPVDTRKAYIEAVRDAMSYFDDKRLRFKDATVQDFEDYVTHLMETGRNAEVNLLGVARYVYMLDMKDVWIYFASILGGREILPSIAERLGSIAGADKRGEIFSRVNAPPLGSKPESYCEATSILMKEFKDQLSPEVYRRVLAGNHHHVPLDLFEKHKKRLKELDGDIDAWLKKMHEDAVGELETYLREDRVWFEQVITRGIIDYVKGNQEILAGVRDGEWIYNTKFPYAPQDYLDATDPLMKRYYMCHCPLARDTILKNNYDIPMDWCYCSAGYGKVRFDVAFEEETEAEVLESVLGGSDKCRFRFRIPEKYR